jgi:hypothetical protein
VPSFFHHPSASKGRQDWNLMTQRLAHFSSLQHSSVISLISTTKVAKITLKHHEIGFESQKSPNHFGTISVLLRYQPIIFQIPDWSFPTSTFRSFWFVSPYREPGMIPVCLSPHLNSKLMWNASCPSFEWIH